MKYDVFVDESCHLEHDGIQSPPKFVPNFIEIPVQTT